MRQTIKNVVGIVAVVALSAGVAGFTTYKMMQVNQKNQSFAFNDVFQQNSDAKLASFDVNTQPIDLTKAAESSLHAVVHIQSTQRAKAQSMQAPNDIFEYFFGNRGRNQQQQMQPQIGFGSGVIISKDGYIVTNNHVIDGADEITVKLNDNREFKGRMIGSDPSTDLALIKIESKDDLPTIPVGNSDNLKVGEWVLAVGNPFNFNSTVTAGIVSAKARSLGVYNGGVESFIQTDAAINRGNSGGALVNAKGELVGINSVLSSPTGTYAGYGFAIPTTIMTKVVSDLKEFGTVQRALLGIKGASLGGNLMEDQQPIDNSGTTLRDKAKEFGVTGGVWVREIVDGGSASESDIRVDDVIVAINDKKVHSFADLQEALAQYRPGDKVNVKIVREKKDKTVSILLKNEQGTTKVIKEAGMDLLGAAFKELSADLKKQLNLGYGLQVTGVNGGKMHEAGVRKGFIILKANDQPMRTMADLENVMKSAVKSPNQVLFLTGMFPSGKRAYYAVDLTQE